MARIKELHAREISDSRGNPTIEVSCLLESGTEASASVPSGTSTGSHEALELKDISRARQNVEGEILTRLRGREFDQDDLDRTLAQLDGTENKSRLGANAILGVSLAFARASALDMKLELYEYLGGLVGNDVWRLPVPFFNLIEGGRHAESGLEIQEFHIVPEGVETFAGKVEAAKKIVSRLKDILEEGGYRANLGEEGGFSPELRSNEEAINLLEEAIKTARYDFNEIKLGLDAAATSFYKNGFYEFKIKGEKKKLHREELLKWYEDLVKDHQLISIEDGFAEDDWGGFSHLMFELGEKVMVVGDDLLATNVKRIEEAAMRKAVNAVLIKPNQIGTVTETLNAIREAKKLGFKAFVSHRAGETFDTFIADLAVGAGCEYIKAGAPVQPERIAKYERLIEIEKKLK
ncbi:MAG: phosphopyruvate hydratase [Candidatus Zambryskibacteria bacterium RIFCSPLOWO2_02_FULL_51_21]|uniref:Enolase n=1 Tax=Candidatus Zambryskibacteria bacterium RIFCSPHIGHO2_02_FULL_43_37 TaxID=1802749 RepID=A0A1G2THP7_9BACT|nr:MAG: phosphopyruvate hydratase [Candidatus Zambryskibacteria bacterium RIFCSPHIGHO2_01_FULL_52_18]OHA96722.1 MAG: phosphopyruvate hydratase [Candidatus Zambryskibacteria bacterium RIFCSPHIGHO2_02_FULL_43_37]OHB07415.1 MAG: phosphopyruvate hydratase [Candidatus Zambryskibacteria bacterium RIFCSPLOWO2_01_FULL_52_12]OHB11077.1 MAG: phosphopyruvate hydratase [Candidatus Zambryskibacteria bacterium RIFCSPLOWO2_02_FULL_51_21]